MTCSPTSRYLTRRDFHRLVGVGTAAAIIAPRMAFAQERKPLVFAVDNLWPTMDPVIGISTTGARVHSNIFDHLIERNYYEDPDGNTLVSGLAVKWEQTAPTVWTITLRDGVKFHNGDPMTAEDVAFSLSAERLWGPEPLAPRGSNYAHGLVRVEATGPLTVELETEYEDPTFIARLSTPIGFVLPKNYYEQVGTDAFGQKPVGTGPYKLVEFDPSSHLRAEAWDEYWSEEKPPFSEVTWVIVPEYSTRYAGLAAGKYDLIIGVPVDQIGTLTATRGISVLSSQIPNYPMFAFNTLTIDGMEDNPLVDANLRKAMVSAIDMDGLTRELWQDLTYTPTPFNFPEYGPYYDPDRKAEYPYDPERARELLAASSYKGQEMRWHIVRGFYENYEIAAEFMVDIWREIGINVKIVLLDNFSLAYQRPFHLLNMSMSSEFTGDPYRPLWLDWGPGSSRVTAAHRTWVPTPEFLEAGERFAHSIAFEEKYAAYLEMLKAWEDVTPAMYMWRNVQTFGMRDGLNFNPGDTNITLFMPGYLDG